MRLFGPGFSTLAASTPTFAGLALVFNLIQPPASAAIDERGFLVDLTEKYRLADITEHYVLTDLTEHYRLKEVE